MRRGQYPDGAALTFTAAVHGAVFLLLMLERPPAPQPRARPSDLIVFDVGASPPPPLPRPTFQTLPKRLATTLPGGSRPAAAPPIVEPVDAAPQAPVLLPPQQPSATSLLDDADENGLLATARSSDPLNPGRNGDGTGTGTGNGVGSGSLRFAHAEWIREPDLGDVQRYLPGRARARSVTVSVELGCIIPTPGKPKRCWVVSENPAGFGFGHAAVAMSSTFRIRPVFLNDQALDRPVLVPIVFRVMPRPSPPTP